METKELTFTFSVEEANIILTALNEVPLPLKTSAPLVHKIRTQAEEQLRGSEQTPEPFEAESE